MSAIALAPAAFSPAWPLAPWGRSSPARRRARGEAAYSSGLRAEETAARHYQRRGATLAARRWQSGHGEVDLIVREGDRVVFVEVKRAATLADAAHRLTRRQADRLCAAAAIFCEGEPRRGLTEMRFDLALVDASGRIEVIENAFGADY